jgi:hypothetical protein
MSVHEILNAITEAKTALDREPVLQSRITELEHNLDKSQRHAQELEFKLMERNATIDQLQSKCRSLEVERDDMGFRELEAQDKLDALRNVVKVFTTQAETLMVQPISITEAEPVSESVTVNPTPIQDPDPDQWLRDHPQMHVSEAATVGQTEPQSPPLSSYTVSEAGQSASPLPQSVTTPTTGPNQASAATTVTTTEGVTSPKPYESKTYSQVQNENGNQFIPMFEWTDKGGTEANYWR